MTRKHFEQIAATLLAQKPVCDSPDALALRVQWNEQVRAMARMCAESNPRFDNARFMVACGYSQAIRERA
jgi:hypothetical protein